MDKETPMKKNTFRIQIGFIAGIVFLWRADPTMTSFAAGAALMVFGEAIRFISAGTLVKFEGVTRDGIYACVRNPLYIGSFFIGLGACVIGRDIWFTAVYTAAYILIYRKIILREETWLTGRYGGDYLSYVGDVPRIIPRRVSPREILAETAPFLAVKNRELKTVAGIAAVWIVLALKVAI